VSYRRGDWRDKLRIERAAAALRAELGLDQLEVLDPGRLARHLGVDVLLLGDLITDELELWRARAAGWDGMASQLPDGPEIVVVLNCGRPPRRRVATLMEELAHLHLEHRPCSIRLDCQLGVSRRSYDRAQEEEAYDLGAALLLPKERIQRDLATRLLVGEIADAHGCSTALVNYRIRRLRLWARYSGYARRAS
jgi:hypothetical protein